MRALVLEGVKRPADVEKRDIRTAQDDTPGLPGRKFLGANGFHRGILGERGRFGGRGSYSYAYSAVETDRSIHPLRPGRYPRRRPTSICTTRVGLCFARVASAIVTWPVTRRMSTAAAHSIAEPCAIEKK